MMKRFDPGPPLDSAMSGPFTAGAGWRLSITSDRRGAALRHHGTGEKTPGGGGDGCFERSSGGVRRGRLRGGGSPFAGETTGGGLRLARRRAGTAGAEPGPVPVHEQPVLYLERGPGVHRAEDVLRRRRTGCAVLGAADEPGG